MVLLFLLLPPLLALAQSSSPPPSSPSPSPSPSPSLSVSQITSTATVTLATSRQGLQPSQFTTVLPVVSNVTFTITPSPTSSSTPLAPSSASSVVPSPSATPDPFVLATRVDPAFAVLGVILILTGLPSTFWGHKNRWTSFFLIGFYTLSLITIVLILKFGVLSAINPPSQTIRGLFLLASTIAGIIGGAIAIFFWKGARYGIGAWGGFALGLWIQCFRDGGLIRTIGFRWILYIGCGVVGFALSTIPKIHYHVLLASTAVVGATSFMLGVDCFTTAGLKEFYIWNLGFPSLFPRFVDHGIQFPVSQTMQIELGLTGAVALMGIAVQLRILKVLQKKMQEIAEETQRRDEEEEGHAAARIAGSLERERSEWEKDHPTLTKHGRQDSNLSMMPLMKDREASSSPSSHLQDNVRQRHLSNVSDFKVAPTSDEELKRASRVKQIPGALPQLDLGIGIQEDVPSTFIAEDDIARKVEVSAAELQDFKRKQALLQEIQTIRKSIEVLKSETPTPSSTEHSRRPSFSSKRTLSIDASTALLPPSHLRPPREMAPPPRGRVRSMELSSLANTLSVEDPISRPTSVPLKDNDWDSYIQERKLLQPPSGVSAPIGTNVTPRPPFSPAVQEALQLRKHRENAIAASSHSSEDIPLARLTAHSKTQSSSHISPVTILPPRRQSTSILAPAPVPAPRQRTFEELNERHREKMRDIQAPLTQAQKEHAEIEAARQRWERSKALEKEAVTRRQAEKAAALEKRRKSAILDDGEAGKGGNRASPNEERARRRSLSADKLGNPGTSSSRRLSTLKVEDWQRYQQDAEMGVKTEQGGGSKRESRGTRPVDGVPFPNEPGRRRKSRDFLT